MTASKAPMTILHRAPADSCNAACDDACSTRLHACMRLQGVRTQRRTGSDGSFHALFVLRDGCVLVAQSLVDGGQ